MTIAVRTYRITRSFPKAELYGIVSQMRRAATSVPSNVAEGFNRLHNKDYRRFLHVALGSCAELETQVELSAMLGFMDDGKKECLLEDLDHESRMLRNLAKKLNVD